MQTPSRRPDVVLFYSWKARPLLFGLGFALELEYPVR